MDKIKKPVSRDDYMLLYNASSSRSSIEKSQAFDSAREMLSIAPMMEVTTRCYRQFMRFLTLRTQLWTEMIVDQTIIHQDTPLGCIDSFLEYEDTQHPLVLQLGGSNPEHLGAAVDIANRYQFDEINLNCGCPSATVSGNCFGARLMLDPQHVARICKEMIRRASTDTEITVKCRLGADDRDSYEELVEFIQTVASAGVRHFQIHARKCLLSGLTTKQNRRIPPIKYDWIRRLQNDFPTLGFSLNGHVETLETANKMLWDVNHPPLRSVMIGRAAWHNPWIFSEADSTIFGTENPIYNIVDEWREKQGREMLHPDERIEKECMLKNPNNSQSSEVEARVAVAHKYLDYLQSRTYKGTRKYPTSTQMFAVLPPLFTGIKGKTQFTRAINEARRKRKVKGKRSKKQENIDAILDDVRISLKKFTENETL
eukprot:g1042.t1